MWGGGGFTGIKCSTTFLSIDQGCLLEIFIINLRVVYWNDANGSTFVMAKIGNDWFEDHDIVVEDCTVRIIIVIHNIFECKLIF